jgi:endonuclease/exonuclease/phosphatase family metal-dependent hydrolase
VIRSLEPDVVVVQESPRFARWRSLCAQLARLGNLVVVGGGRYAGSNLILSSLSVDVVSSADVLFSREPFLHRRGTAIAVLTKQGTPFAVAGTHLDLQPEPRLRHVAELETAIAAHVPADVPTVVAADVNDTPGSAVWHALTMQRKDAFAVAGRGSAFTSPAREPVETLDGLFVDPRITVRSVHVLDIPDVLIASDHRPIVADLDL